MTSLAFVARARVLVALALGATSCGPELVGPDATSSGSGGASADAEPTVSASGAGSSADDVGPIDPATADDDDAGETPSPICGDGRVEGVEACDDGNRADRDGCEHDCVPSPSVVTHGPGATTCAISGGRLQCWGVGCWMGHGTMGLCEIGDDEAPGEVGDIPLPGVPVDFTRSSGAACVLLSTGQVACWGKSRIGGGDESCLECEAPACCVGDDEPIGVEAIVDLPRPAVEIAGGEHNVCARLDDGGVVCWGHDIEGALGRGRGVDGEWVAAADADLVDVGGPVVDISSGPGACAVLEDGGVRCWGACSFWTREPNGKCLGYLSEEIIGDDETPREAGDLPLPKAATQVDFGGDAEGGPCVRFVDGTAACLTKTKTTPEWEMIELDRPIWRIGRGLSHACALVEGATVRCWGSGSAGALGYGVNYHLQYLSPQDVGDVPVGGPVQSLSAGHQAACVALTSGGIRCWGSGTAQDPSRLGYPGNVETIGDDETPSSMGDIPAFFR